MPHGSLRNGSAGVLRQPRATSAARYSARGVCDLYYWRERGREVDFVVRTGRSLVAIEVKSGRAPTALPGLAVFAEAFKPSRMLLVGGDGIPVAEFLSKPVEHWLHA